MTRRQLALLSLSLVALASSACADTTAPNATSPALRQVQPTGTARQDIAPDDCKSTYGTSSGKTC